MKNDLHAEIREIIAAYYKWPKNGTDAKTLMKMRSGLACLKYGLAVQVGELYDEKNATEYRRKSAFAQERGKAIGAKESAAKAEALASEATTEHLKDEMSADAAYRAGYLVLDAVTDVLAAMSQHIANLRQERHEEMTVTGSQSA